MQVSRPATPPKTPRSDVNRQAPPELFQVVIECEGEEQQRELFERLRREGMKVRLMVL